MIQYSERSRRAIGRLFSPYNDIDVYVEDKTYVGVYEKLINRALRGKAKVTRVIALGPKDEVLKAASQDLNTSGRPRLYVVDGDLDLIAFKRQQSYPHLYRLNVYSIENLLFDELAIERYCSFASPSLANGRCIAAVQPLSMLADIETLTPYIVAIAIARRLKLRDGIFAFNPPSVNQATNGRLLGPDGRRTYSRIRQVVRAIIDRVGVDRFKAAKKAVVENVSRRNLGDHRIVPAKAFGVVYLNERVIAAGGVSLPQKMVVSYLADYASLELDKRFASRLRRVAR